MHTESYSAQHAEPWLRDDEHIVRNKSGRRNDWLCHRQAQIPLPTNCKEKSERHNIERKRTDATQGLLSHQVDIKKRVNVPWFKSNCAIWLTYH